MAERSTRMDGLAPSSTQQRRDAREETVMPLIIVDGPDRVGKGTFIRKLRAHWADMQQAVIHNDAPPPTVPLRERREWALGQYAKQYRWASDHPDVLWIIDRGHYSETVYGDLYRGEKTSPMALMIWERLVLKMLEGIPTASVILHEEVPELLRRDDGQSTFSHNHMMAYKELEYFHRLRQATKFPLVKDPTPKGVDKVLGGQLAW